MSRFRILFCLFLFCISLVYVIDSFKNVNVVDFILSDNKQSLTFKALSNSDISLEDSFNDKSSSVDVMISNNSNKKSISKEPLVYIYNTHQTEEYGGNVYNITPSVRTVSDILKDELELLNINSVVEDRSVTKEVKKRGLDYSGTYTVSLEYLKDKKKKYPSLEYFFDMHRDSITGDSARVVIDGKKYATMMFLVGTKNSNYKKNVKNIKIMEGYLNKYYKGLVRDTYYQSHSSFYQDYSDKMFLVELGGPDNTLEEIYNTSVALSKAIKYYVEESYEK